MQIAETQVVIGEVELQHVGYRLATYALLAGALLRVILIVILDPHFIDFYCFVDAAQALMRGVDPFKLENLRWVRWEEAPLVYPGLALFFVPFALIGPDVGKYIFYAANVSAGAAYYAVVVRASGRFARFSLRSPDLQTTVVALGAFLFVNSIFFTLCIRVGQISIFAALLLFLSLTARSEASRVVSFGLAAVAKYSNAPIVGLYYVLSFRFRLCLLSFSLFAFVSAIPIVFGHNPIGLYSSYEQSLLVWMAPGGGNSFASSGQTILSAGFFKPLAAQICINVFFAAAFILMGRKILKDRASGHSLHSVLMLACLTLAILYHRVYDGVLVYPLILLEFAEFVRRGDRINSTIAGFFVFVFALPGSLLERAAIAGGKAIGENPLIHLPAGQFPLASVLFFLLTIYSVFLFAKGTPTCILGASPDRNKTAGC